MVLASKVKCNQANKSKLGEISNRLRNSAHDVANLSETQPDFSERMRDTHKELMAMVYRLRGVN